MPIDPVIKSEDGVNVIPVSTIRVFGSQIWLFDYFMKKTERNLRINPQAGLVCWKAMDAYQFKGKSGYKTSGMDFDRAKEITAELNPERRLKGLVVFTPEQIFLVSPQSDSTKNILK